MNNAYAGALQRGGLVVSGINPRRNLVEIVELKDHPWFLAVQFHPEFQSKPYRAHPLFAAFIAAAWRIAKAKPKAGGKTAEAAAGKSKSKVKTKAKVRAARGR